MNKYLKFEYWNECDLGNIYYQGGQKFMFYLDADVGEPLHEDIEEGQENGDGDFIPTYRRQIKRYRIRTGLIPDFLIDAMQRMKLHDNIELTFKTGEIEKIYNVDIETEWQFEKYAWQGTVTMTFDMDESITVGACCENLVVGEVTPPEPIPDLYWVAENGSDLIGNGSYTRPWATLGYATTQATTPGDVIHVKAGTITETVQSNLAIGVSIIGAGDTSIINFTYGSATEYCIKLYSASLTDGNQSISYLKLTGSNYTARRAILVWQRNNVSVHHIAFEKFDYEGVNFIYPYSMGEPNPIEFCSGNSFYNNTLLNCAGYHGDNGYGALNINGQDGISVHDNDFTQNNTAGLNGPPIKAVDGVNKNIKIYNNNTYQPAFGNGDHWDFAFELWDCRGGCEIYDNNLQGSIDLGGKINVKGSSTYSIWVHNNVIQQPAQSLSSHTRGFILEAHLNNEDIIIEKNHVKYTCLGIGIGQPNPLESTVFQNIRISYNIFESLGLADSQATNSKGWGIWWPDPADWQTCDNFQILNNVFTGKVGTYSTMWGVQVPAVVSTNIVIRNNIIRYFDYAPVFGYNDGDPDITCDILSIENNCFYDNGYSNLPRYGAAYTPTNNTTQNNVVDDPVFIGGSPYDYHLQAGSPCINAGVYVGLTTDYDGQPVGNPPDIGAYEY